jgi:V/A-type H+-transporting ATPase subunit G/H
VTRSDTLLQIKDAEVKAAQIVKDADEKHKQIVAAARREAVAKIQAAEEKQRQDYESAYAAEKSKISTQREEIIRKGNNEAQALNARAESKVNAVVDHLLAKFESSL